jgi:predicted alpha/beta-hydrolase family hydrolase
VTKGHVLLSHGLESGPDATKVTAMAAVAQARGWRTTRPDFRDLDATGDPLRIDDRIRRLCAAVRPDEPLVLAGSSMGAFASGLASRGLPCIGLFLLAPPLAIPGYANPFALASVPTTIVHGWDDELIPAAEVIAFARDRQLDLHLVADSHRLAGHVEIIADWFGLFLDRLP